MAVPRPSHAPAPVASGIATVNSGKPLGVGGSPPFLASVSSASSVSNPSAASASGAASAVATDHELPFELVDHRYELTREAGRGGMCVVYEAHNRFTGRVVALKRLLPEVARSADVRARLLQEARALGMVRHPNVVDVHDAGETPQGPYLAMEMLSGRSLEGMLAARGSLTIAEVVEIARQSAAALAAVHAVGIVHRDVKPGNLLIVESEQRRRVVKLIDLGLAQMPESAATSNKITRTATILGTPEYLPLEILTASVPFSTATDVYSLGVTLYECLTGTVPFPGNYAAVLRQSATSDPMPVLARRNDVPAAFAAVVDKALARDPAARYPDARAMGVAIEAACSEQRPEPKPAAPASLGPRRFARVPFITPVRVRFDQGMLEGRSEDLSEAGLMVLLPVPLPEGSTVQLRFTLPRTGEVVGCTAVARWVRTREARACAVGLELLDVSSRVRAAIADYVRSGGV